MNNKQLKQNSIYLYEYLKKNINKEVTGDELSTMLNVSKRTIRKCCEFLRPHLRGATICSGDYGYMLTDDHEIITDTVNRLTAHACKELQVASYLKKSMQFNQIELTLEV